MLNRVNNNNNNNNNITIKIGGCKSSGVTTTALAKNTLKYLLTYF